jgi:transcriptional regulator with XRE-family HTH domain
MLNIDRLTERRLFKKFTHKDMASKLGITRQGYGNYESGKRDVDTETLVKISEILETNSAYLLGETDDPSPLEKRESNLSFYGGPNDWTEEEFKAADDFIKEIREARQRALDKANKEQQ